MSNGKKKTLIEDDEGPSLADYLDSFSIKVKQAAKLAPPPPEKDENLIWVRTPAPNAIQWTIGAQFLNNPSTFDHKRQYQVIRDFFELRCPMCNPSDPEAIDCWDKTRMYLEDEVLLEWHPFYNTDVCPKCKTTRFEFVEDGLFKNYNQMHGVVGMRGGKTVTASIAASFIEHRVITYAYSTDGGLPALFHHVPNQMYEMTFIASSDTQSKDTVWAHFVGRRQQSPWIQRYVKWLKDVEKATPKMNGLKTVEYTENDKEISNDHIRVTFNSLNSNSSGMAGRTRLAAAVDELARFQAADGRQSADEAYRVLENSLKTVRSDATRLNLPPYFGSMISITSPISAEDKAMLLLKQAPEIKRMYAFHYPTWLFNPFQPRENFDEDYIKDPLGAERDFGANPPAAVNPLIEDRERFRRSVMDPNLKPTSEIEYYTKQDKVGNSYKAARMLKSALKSVGEADRMVVFDAGLTFDTFGGACAHGEWWDGPDGNKIWTTVYDWVLRIIPEAYPSKLDVWFDSVIDIVQTLKAKQRIGAIEFDRWNSAALIQAIRNIGIPAEQKGTMVQDFVKFVADANLGRIRMVPPSDDEDTDRTQPDKLSAYGTVFYELERLQRSPDLRKVFNPKKGERRGWNSDDVAQCVVHAHRLVQEQVAVNTSGHTHSAEARLKAEQIGGNTWGRQNGGGIYRPKSDSMRRW